MSLEKDLGNLLGADDDSRVRLVQVADPGETPTLELRLERDAGELGWQTHRRIRLAPGQIGALKEALGMMDPRARQARHPGSNSEKDDNVIELTALRRHTS